MLRNWKGISWTRSPLVFSSQTSKWAALFGTGPSFVHHPIFKRGINVNCLPPALLLLPMLSSAVLDFENLQNGTPLLRTLPSKRCTAFITFQDTRLWHSTRGNVYPAPNPCSMKMLQNLGSKHQALLPWSRMRLLLHQSLDASYKSIWLS